MIMIYKVTRFFYDLQDGDHLYNVGDSYPREGLAVSNKRIAELMSGKNRLRVPVIAEEPKKTRRKKEE